MSFEAWMLVATAVLAVVAISAAVIAVRAARRVAAGPAASPASRPAARHAPQPAGTDVAQPTAPRAVPTGTAIAIPDPATPARTAGPQAASRVVEGRLVTPPTQQQVVQTALGRPGVRLSVLAHGVAHAMRAESRDRISALMRREYRRRRRQRQQAGRHAVRAAQPTPPADRWLGS